jgi:hypothetical protein
MAGDEQVRFCTRCQQKVFNLSAMTAEQATTLLAQREGALCVRFYRRQDGTFMTADCPFGLQQFVPHPWQWVAAGLAVVLALLGAVVALFTTPQCTQGTFVYTPPRQEQPPAASSLATPESTDTDLWDDADE